ncbi:hypothetical protein NPIL_178211 [Nephila pilipes]|uniref:Uncharacterized protein n=1 Tax=Nephila pilipes TaxID=299642 RepID=A0A8X6UE14_NEPPI|nr:hypothetical protein NPIL_178211 [Nephila pilipes]
MNNCSASSAGNFSRGVEDPHAEKPVDTWFQMFLYTQLGKRLVSLGQYSLLSDDHPSFPTEINLVLCNFYFSVQNVGDTRSDINSIFFGWRIKM